jgi:hypothetical protein
MTDVEELRAALHARPAEPLPELDIGQIMKDGGRLRRRRRVRTGVVSAAVLSALVGGMALSQVGSRQAIEVAASQAPNGPSAAAPMLPPTPNESPGRGLPTTAGSAEALPTATIAPSNSPTSSPGVTSTNRPPASPGPPADVALGKVIPVESQSLGSQVLYMTQRAGPTPSGTTTTYTLVSGRQVKGRLSGQYQVRATIAKTGFQAFHPVPGSSAAGPAFGYYRGSVAAISVTDQNGVTIPARRTTWSSDPSVVIFWFTPEDLTADLGGSTVTAKNTDGTVASIPWQDLGQATML